MRRDGAALLAAIAAFGLVGAPLLHAEEHDREARADEQEAAETAADWEAQSRNPEDVLATALKHVHGERPRPPEHHRHSHGAGSREHGTGSLAHFAFALHPAAPPPLPARAPVAHAAPPVLGQQTAAALTYLVPEWSQGPPQRC